MRPTCSQPFSAQALTVIVREVVFINRAVPLIFSPATTRSLLSAKWTLIGEDEGTLAPATPARATDRMAPPKTAILMPTKKSWLQNGGLSPCGLRRNQRSSIGTLAPARGETNLACRVPPVRRDRGLCPEGGFWRRSPQL